MSDVLAEKDVRDRFVVTIPLVVRDILNIGIGDRVRWERNDDGDICFFKVASHRVNSGRLRGDT